MTKLNLPTSKPLCIGIDQSSTCSGVYLTNDDVKLLIAIPRNALTIEEYKHFLITQIRVLLNGKKVHTFVIEQHHPEIAPPYSVIHEITKALRDFSRSPLIIDTKIKTVTPPVWRKGFFSLFEDTSEVKYTREFIKDDVTNHCCKLIPELTKFKQYSTEDYDAFEAMAIYEGYQKLNYSNGMRIVNTSMPTRADRSYRYQIFTTNEFKLKDTLANLLTKHSLTNEEIILANREILFEESCNRISGEYQKALLLTNDVRDIQYIIFKTLQPYYTDTHYITLIEKR